MDESHGMDLLGPGTTRAVLHAVCVQCSVCQESVRLRSLCPTFASVAVFINNARWAGVPFLLKAGKALASRRAEIRVQFHQVPGGLYQDKLGHDGDRSSNELVRTPARTILHDQNPACHICNNARLGPSLALRPTHARD